MARRGTRVQKWDAQATAKPRTVTTMSISEVMADPEKLVPMFTLAAAGNCRHGNSSRLDRCPECILMRGWVYVSGIGRVEVVADSVIETNDESNHDVETFKDNETGFYVCPSCGHDTFRITPGGLAKSTCVGCDEEINLIDVIR